jgi:hypothetical protein
MRHAPRPELKVVASPALLERGCVNVITLDEIKTEAGARWEKLRGSVTAHLESLLRQKLGSSDFFVPLDDTAYLVSMPEASAEASQIFCLRIAHELHTSMLGHCELRHLRLARAVRLDDDEIQTAEIGGPELVRLAVMAGLDCISESERLAARRAAPRVAAPKKRDFSHRYVPLWDAQREAITTWRCVTDPVPGTNPAASVDFKAELAAALSRIKHGERSLTEHMKVGTRFLVSVPLSYDTLTSPAGRMEIASACRALSSALRPYLIFEIGDLPYGVPQSRLSELVCILKPFSRAVAAVLPPRTSNFGDYQSAGVHAIGISLAAMGAGVGEMENEVAKLCLAAKRLHMMSFVLEAATAEAVRLARTHGANLISSPLVGGAVASPSSVKRLLAREVMPAARAAGAKWVALG